jgi:ATP-grasp domain
MNPKVLLTDTNRMPEAARLAIGLAKTGCDVSVVCPGGHPLLKARSLRQAHHYSGFRPLKSLQAAIQAAEPHIIIPCDDRGVRHLHELYFRALRLGESGRDLTVLIERSLGSPEGYPIVLSRYSLLTIAQELELRVPGTSPVRTVEDLQSWRSGQRFPCVLKADGTFGGRGVRIAHTSEQAAQFFSEITELYATKPALKRLIVNRDAFWLRPWRSRYRPAVIVQSHIQGRPANCAVVCWEGRVLAGIAVEVLSSQGITGPATVVRVVENFEMMQAAERIARRLGLSGFFGLDFVIEQGTGAAYLIEMNPRCTPLCHLQLGKGRDLVGALWSQLSGQPFREAPAVTENDRIAYFPQAWSSKSELLQSCFQDIPRDEPDLAQELLHPWPSRSLLFRLASKGQDLTKAVSTQKSFN